MTDITEFARQAVRRFAENQQHIVERLHLDLSPESVEHFIKSCFHASLIPDENRWPSATLMCYRKRGENDFHIHFKSPRDISAGEIAKLAHAVAADCHICCISDNRKLTI